MASFELTRTPNRENGVLRTVPNPCFQTSICRCRRWRTLFNGVARLIPKERSLRHTLCGRHSAHRRRRRNRDLERDQRPELCQGGSSEIDFSALSARAHARSVILVEQPRDLPHRTMRPAHFARVLHLPDNRALAAAKAPPHRWNQPPSAACLSCRSARALSPTPALRRNSPVPAQILSSWLARRGRGVPGLGSFLSSA